MKDWRVCDNKYLVWWMWLISHIWILSRGRKNSNKKLNIYFITVVSISFSVHIKLSSLKMGTFYNKDSWEMFLYNNNMVHSYRLSILRSHLHISIRDVNEHFRNFHSDSRRPQLRPSPCWKHTKWSFHNYESINALCYTMLSVFIKEKA